MQMYFNIYLPTQCNNNTLEEKERKKNTPKVTIPII